MFGHFSRSGSDRKPNFIIFLVWSALVVVGVVMACSRKSSLGPAEVRLKFFALMCRNIMTLLMNTVSLAPQTTSDGSIATHCTFSIVFTASAKISEREGSI